MSLNLDIEKSKDHNNLTLLAFNPHTIIKKMLLNNYIELEDNCQEENLHGLPPSVEKHENCFENQVWEFGKNHRGCHKDGCSKNYVF